MDYKRTKFNYRKFASTHYNMSVAGKHVHHIDGNNRNNNPENLIICTPSEHAQFHREMGQETIALLLEGQKLDLNWFSIIGKLGAEKSKSIPKSKYTISNLVINNLEYIRSLKGDPFKTKVALKGECRTSSQKEGRSRATQTKFNRDLTELEQKQLDEFRKKGHEAAKLAATGSKKFIHPITGIIKFAKPNSEKWFRLLNEQYVPK